MKKSADALIAGSLPAATIGTFGSALLKRFLRGASSTCGAGNDEADGGGADSGNGTERSSLLTTVVFLVAFLAILGTGCGAGGAGMPVGKAVAILGAGCGAEGACIPHGKTGS